MANKQKSGKKQVNRLGANAGKVGAAIAGALLAEMAQSAFSKSLNSSNTEDELRRAEPSEGSNANVNKNPDNAKKSRNGKAGKRLKILGSNSRKIGAAIAGAVLAEVAQKVFDSSDLSTEANKLTDKPDMPAQVANSVKNVVNSVRDGLEETSSVIHDKIDETKETVSESQGTVADAAQAVGDLADTTKKSAVGVGKDLAKTVDSAVSDTAAFLPKGLSSAAQSIGAVTDSDSKDDQKKGKKKKASKNKKKQKK